MPFTFKKLSIPSVVLIQPRLFKDSRGFFRETFKASEFAAFGLPTVFVQGNHSHSAHGVVRALHYQKNEQAQGKLLAVTQGEIFDVAVDIRQGSPTYGQWVAEILSAKNGHMLYIPAGFAHGFCVLSDSADLAYQATREYAPHLETGILWNDPTIGIVWPISNPILSNRDLALPTLAHADNNFVFAESRLEIRRLEIGDWRLEIKRTAHFALRTMHYAPRILLIGLLLLVTACSQRRGAVLIAWHTLDGAKERALLKLADRWNATNPDGTVIVLERRDLETLHTGVLNSRATNALPALMLVRPMQAAVYQQQGFLAPLDAYINNPETGWDEADMKDLFPFVRAAGQTPQRETVGLAFGGKARALLYNQDSLTELGIEALPATWKAMNDACALATNRIQNTFCFSVLVTHQTLEDWTTARSGQLVSADGSLMQVTTDVPTGVMNSLQTYLQLGQAYPTPGAADTRAQFSAGNTPFAFAWSDEIAAYRNTIRQSENFDWRVAALPNDEGQPAGTTMQNAVWVLLKSADGNAQREEASWKFVKWLLDEAQTAEWASATGELPARASALARLAANPTVDPLFISAAQTLAPIAQPEPLLSGWGCVQSALSAGMRTLFESKPITETVQAMQQGAQSQLGFDCTLR